MSQDDPTTVVVCIECYCVVPKIHIDAHFEKMHK